MSLHRAVFLSLLTPLLVPGCRKEGDDVTTIINSLVRGPLDVTANGGGASGNATIAFGGQGGNLSVTSSGNLFAGVNPAPFTPALPAAPTTGTPVTNWSDFQTIATGNAIVNGAVTADTTGTTATLIVSTGDLVINGSITSADNGAVETDISINVLAGTVWIAGTIRTGNVDGIPSGDDGGSLTITAQRIIFTGVIDTRGEPNAGDGGDGGPVSFDTEGVGTGQTSQLFVGGSVNQSGGNATGFDVLGGDGGTFSTYLASVSNGAIYVQGTTFTLNGGSATGTGDVLGGLGGSLDLQGNAGVFFNGAYSGTGGAATSSDGGAEGGTGGAWFANDLAIADSGPVALFGSVNVTGGAAGGGPASLAVGGDSGGIFVVTGSDANLGTGTWSLRGANSSASGGEGGNASLSAGSGGQGDVYVDAVIDVSDGNGPESVQGGIAGTIDIDTTLGDIQISGTLLANGGDGSSDSDVLSGPSDGGSVGVQTADGGTITIRSVIQANGGSDSNGADDNDGATGGLIQFLVDNSAGSIYLEPGSLIHADGGNAGGVSSAPFGGDGGQIQLLTGGGSVADGTIGGNINMHGTIAARGGEGLGFVGSFGGFGGDILIESDSPASGGGGGDGRGGDITLHAGATVDASGGPGGSGGDGLNDGITLSVTSPVAVTFDSDGDDSDDPAENGIVRNLGLILSRGIGTGAIGGDVLFDGLDASLSVGPLPGVLDLLGSGALGDFLSQ